MVIELLAAALLQVHVSGRHVDVFGEGEAARKAAREADAAGERFRELIGAAPVRGAIVLTREPKSPKDVAYARHGARFIWRWEARAAAEPDETMTHELGHLWLAFWADGMEPPKAKRYGSSLPDWFDEGVASLLEGPKAHRAYAEAMRKRAASDTAMALADLLECVHPDSRERTEKAKAKDRWLFYAQSYSVVAFLAERGALAHVATALKSGKMLEGALGRKGLPGTLDAFDGEWREWLAAPEK